MLYAKKIAFKQSSYYLISLDKNSKTSRGSMVFKDHNLCIGKLRAIDRHKYILYDNGESYSNQNNVNESHLRIEHGVFLFSYVPCNVGNIRKVTVLLPTVKAIEDENSTNFLESRSNSVDQRDQHTKKTAMSTENSHSIAGASDNKRRGSSQIE